jgi:hypothetical protein
MRANIAKTKTAKGAENNGKNNKPGREGRADRRKGSRARAAREGTSRMGHAVKHLGKLAADESVEISRGAVCAGSLNSGARISIVVEEAIDEVQPPESAA